MLKNNKAITLIALVVTVIVLLILAGISISMLTGQNGILNRAHEAKEKTKIANQDEQRKLAQAEALMNTEETTYKGVTIPKGFAPTRVEGEDSVDAGLVITDGKGNEFVWVEVPKTNTVYSTAGTNITNFTDEEYTKIETDLKTYTSEYKADGYSDTNSNFTTQYRNMLKSVYTNGGFWIGRYEAGYEIDESKGEKARNYNDDYYTEHPTTQRVVIKKNTYPYNWVRKEQAQALAIGMDYEGCTSSLIFGVQWDLALKNIETKFIEKNSSSDIKTKLTSNSTTIGNYNTNLCNITNANAKYSINSGNSFTTCPYQKIENVDVLLTTGADESFSLMNIYDIAGNVWEWTLESFGADNCVFRGGSGHNTGLYGPAKDHGNVVNSYSFYTLGFRIGLWK